MSDIPSINAAGKVAFLATRDSDGATGIYTGPDIAGDKVVATGDALFGSTVTALNVRQRALNDLGQVAFMAVLADGRNVVGVATPVLDELFDEACRAQSR